MKYEAGVRNIGKAGVQREYLFSLLGFVLSTILGYNVVLYSLPPYWFYTLTIPFMLGFEGFFQGYLRFSTTSGMLGIYDLNGRSNRRGRVTDRRSHMKDLKTSFKIHLFSLFSSLLLATIIFYPYYFIFH